MGSSNYCGKTLQNTYWYSGTGTCEFVQSLFYVESSGKPCPDVCAVDLRLLQMKIRPAQKKCTSKYRTTKKRHFPSLTPPTLRPHPGYALLVAASLQGFTRTPLCRPDFGAGEAILLVPLLEDLKNLARELFSLGKRNCYFFVFQRETET